MVKMSNQVLACSKWVCVHTQRTASSHSNIWSKKELRPRSYRTEIGFILGVLSGKLQLIHFIVTIQYTVHKEAFGPQGIPVRQQRGEALPWQEVVPTSVNPAAGRQRKEGYEIEAILNYTVLHTKALFQLKKRMNEPVRSVFIHTIYACSQ